MQVYVVLFGVGEASTEGIYSLRSHSEETGLHVETIICFETNEDAFRYEHPEISFVQESSCLDTCVKPNLRRLGSRFRIN